MQPSVPHRIRERTRVRVAAASCLLLCLLAGCATRPDMPAGVPDSEVTAGKEGSGLFGFIGKASDKALEAIGLKAPDVPTLPDQAQVPDSALPDWRISWRLHASDALNVDEQGNSLALLVRIYRLRHADAFLQAPYETFGDPEKEKQALSEDLLSVKEVQLVPGQRHDVRDKVPREARYLGIVALYRQPATGKWRYAFSTPAAQLSGLHLGAHACAMSVQVGETIGTAPRVARSTAPCQ